MNCRNCGAENEPEARFCAECGAPLEREIGSTQPLEDEDEDRTIFSATSQIAEQAKTVSVTQEDVATARAEAETASPAGSEPAPAGPSATGAPGSEGGGREWLNQRNIIIAVVVLLVLCCCCFFLSLGIYLASSGALENISGIMRPIYLYLV